MVLFLLLLKINLVEVSIRPLFFLLFDIGHLGFKSTSKTVAPKHLCTSPQSHHLTLNCM